MTWQSLCSTAPSVSWPWSEASNQPKAQASEQGYESWLRDNFPDVASVALSERHHRLWRWFESLTIDSRQDPRLDVWPRGGAKSSTGQLGLAYVAERKTRNFGLYVCGTQDQADEHVQAVADLLERLGHKPAVNMQGKSKGWRRKQVRTDKGFNLAGYGLDTAVRGVKLGKFRPDIILFDDVDSREDTPLITAKKERAITQGILPASSSTRAALFLQNLILEDGMVDRMLTGKADYLVNAERYGPEPAILDLVTEDARLENGRGYKKIISGTPTWEGQDLEVAQYQILEWGWTAFKRESQHEVYGADGYFFDAGRMLAIDDVPRLIRLGYFWDLAGTQGGGDYTAGVLGGIAPNGNLYILKVVREQMGSDRVRKTIKSEAEWAKTTYPGIPLTIGIPQDPGQAGKDQVAQFEKLLAGFSFFSEPVIGKKAVRARDYADAVNAGNVLLKSAEWNYSYREEHRKFKEDETHDYDDQVDPSADLSRFLRKPHGVKQIRLNY